MNSDTAGKIASFCGDTRRAFACVSKDWYQDFSSQDHVWEQSLLADFGINCRLAPSLKRDAMNLDGHVVLREQDSFKSCWLAWRAYELLMGKRIRIGTIWLRAMRAFETIRKELQEVGALNRLQLRQGSYYLPSRLTQRFGNQPIALECIRAIWGIHNGQAAGLASGGLFGLTQFYNQARALRLLSLQEMSQELGDEFTLVVAKNNTQSPKHAEERLCFDPRELQIGNSYNGHGRTFNSLVFPIQGDVLLLLFEHLARELNQCKRSVYANYWGARHASAFAITNACGSCSIITTRGITVRASYKYLPMQQQEEEGKDLFVYQLEISNSDVREEAVMLVSRHWTFVDSRAPAAQPPQRVEGEGVVGKFPIFQAPNRFAEAFPTLDNLHWCEGAFSYESCTYAHPKSYMEGHLLFAPIVNTPQGKRLDFARAFQVQVGRLDFILPLFAY